MWKRFNILLGLFFAINQLLAQCPASIVDARDNKTYPTVQIGTQCWLASNLEWTDTAYTWDAAQTACMSGWHLPSQAEWATLIQYLGDTLYAGAALGYGGFSGFNVYNDRPNWYWTSDQFNSQHAWYKMFMCPASRVYQMNGPKSIKKSVRCLKNETFQGPPGIRSNSISNVTQNSAMCDAVVTSDAGSTVTSRGVCWSVNQNPTIANSHTVCGSGTGTYSCPLTGLSSNTVYYVRGYAINGLGTVYGNQISFSTGTFATVRTVKAAGNIGTTSALLGGYIDNEGGSPVTAKGICWKTTSNPTINDSVQVNGNGPGPFTSMIVSFSPGITYYARAYATNLSGTAYGNEISFTTLSSSTIPTVTTGDITSITNTSAISGGNIITEGGSTVTAKGVCWSTNQNPTLADAYTTNGGNSGIYSSFMNGLINSTQYYVRAYATNTNGTAYGSQKSFTTQSGINLPGVTTSIVTGITQSSAILTGEVISIGGGSLTARGFCYATTPTPTLSNSYTTDGNTIGVYTHTVTGLTGNTTYYVRSYATNSAGTTYGNQVSFYTIAPGSPCPGTPTVVYSGKTYNTVKIADQCWLKENLDVGVYSATQTNNGIIEKYCYGGNEANCTTYGGLYAWNEAMNWSTTLGAQGICPPGWHIPTKAEWDEMNLYLGGANVAGGKLKEAGYAHWLSPNVGATNESGFTALPGGKKDSGITQNGFFWTSQQLNSLGKYIFRMWFNDDNCVANLTYSDLVSLRCIKD